MRHQPTHPAPSDSVPFMLRGPKSLKTALSIAVASAIGLTPAVMLTSPAEAASTVLTIDSPSVLEGNTGTASLVFHLAYTAPIGNTATYTLATAGGTATSGVDFVAAPSLPTVSFSGTGSAENATVSVTVNGDTLPEANETLTLTATNNGTPSDFTSGTGTITNDDGQPTYTLTTPSPVTETGVTTTTAGVTSTVNKTTRVTATLSQVSGQDVVIPLKTMDGTAVSVGTYKDYIALAGGANITIPAGQLTGFIDITIVDDQRNEEMYQDFSVVPNGSPTGVTAASTPAGMVQIQVQDDDAQPTVSIAGAGLVVEGSPLGFPLTLTQMSEKSVSVDVTTADGVDTATTYGAKAPGDYTARDHTTITFPPNTTAQTALVTTINDTIVESSPETLSASISGAVNAGLGTATSAVGGITDDEPAPTFTWTPMSVTEGNTGKTSTKITVNLSSASSIPVKIDYNTTDGTAVAGTDYTATSGSLVIAAGSQTAEFYVETMGDTVYEPGDEFFNINFSSPNMSVATASLGAKRYTITDDDAAPAVTFGAFSANEGNATNVVNVPVTLAGPINKDVVLNVAAHDGTAVVGGTAVGSKDYVAPAATVTIPAGSTTANIPLTVNGDTVFEGDETLTIDVTPFGGTQPVATFPGVSIGNPAGIMTATVTLKNDDAVPTLSMTGDSGLEGTTLKVNGTIVGTAQVAIPVTLAVAGAAPNAASATDFTPHLVTVSNGAFPPVQVPGYVIAPGTTGTVSLGTIDLNNDTIDEAVETIDVNAKETVASGGTPIGFKMADGIYKINDDPGDIPPALSVSDESIKENEGSVTLTVSEVFDGDTTATEQTITVPWTTDDGTAKAGSRYTKSSGTVTIAPGHSDATISVPILDDKVKQNPQDFYVKLGLPSPAGTTLKKAVGEVTVIDDGDTGVVTPSVPTTVKADKTIVDGPTTVHLTGKASAGSSVDVWGAAYGSSDWKKVTSVTADSDGDWSYNAMLSKTGMVFKASAGGSDSSSVTVWLREKPMMTGASTSSKRVTFNVTVNPAWDDQTVTIQRLYGTVWKTITSGKGDDSGKLALSVRNQPGGATVQYRAWVAGDASMGVLSGNSDAKSIKVRS